jgi:hypothetical protein
MYRMYLVCIMYTIQDMHFLRWIQEDMDMIWKQMNLYVSDAISKLGHDDFLLLYYHRLYAFSNDLFTIVLLPKTQKIIRDYCITSQKTIVSLIVLRLFHLFFGNILLQLRAPVPSDSETSCPAPGIRDLIPIQVRWARTWPARKAPALSYSDSPRQAPAQARSGLVWAKVRRMWSWLSVLRRLRERPCPSDPV